MPLAFVRPSPTDLGLPSAIPLNEYVAGRETIINDMLANAAAAMVEHAVHYGEGEERVAVGAAGFIAILGESGAIAVPSVGANVKRAPKYPKFCAEWWITGDSNTLAKEHPDEIVEVLDLSVATTAALKTIRRVLGGLETETLWPCHACIYKLAQDETISLGTGIWTSRLDDRGATVAKAYKTFETLINDLGSLPPPPTSDELVRREERKGRR